MTKLSITVPKLHCVQKTDIFLSGSDEVYLVAMISLGKLGDLNDPSKKPEVVFARVSPVNDGFRNGTIKSLDLGEVPWTVDIGNAEAFSVSIGLYEKDNDNTYKSLKEEVAKLPKPENTQIAALISDIWANVKKILSGSLTIAILLDVLISVGETIFKEIRKDDLLAMLTFSNTVGDPNNKSVREFQDLRCGRAKYNIQILTEIN